MDPTTILFVVLAIAGAFAAHYHADHPRHGDSLDTIADGILRRERIGWEARRARDEIRDTIKRTMDALR
jgi:hypothetical protein